MKQLLARRDLAQAAADVYGAGAPGGLVGPWDSALYGEVDLECSGAVPVSGERPGDPAWHPVSGDPGGGRGCEVEHDDVRRFELVERLHADTGLEPRARSLEQ